MIAQLHRQIEDAGVPIQGVSGGSDGVRVDFAPEATEQHRQQAQSIVDAFDLSPRRPRSAEAFLSDFGALASDDLNTLVKRLLYERIQTDPYWAINQGIHLPGDEPDV